MPRSWSFVKASVTGTSHAAAGTPCQDAHACVVLPNGVLIAAVADGAGSAKYSDEGAALAVRNVVEFLTSCSETPETEVQCLALLHAAIEDTRRKLEALPHNFRPSDGNDGSLSVQDFATTLLCCLVTDQYLAACQIGDGAIVERTTEGRTVVLTRPQKGEYANETAFLTSGDSLQRATSIVKHSSTTEFIAIFTDGIEILCLTLPGYEAFVPFFDHMFKYARDEAATSEDLARFLSSDRVCKRTDDDKTLLIAVTTPGPAQP